jgi:hypothetical protein
LQKRRSASSWPLKVSSFDLLAGLAISIFVNFNLNKDSSSNSMWIERKRRHCVIRQWRPDPSKGAAEIQKHFDLYGDALFSIAHWCVFPSEEWEPDYRPKQYAHRNWYQGLFAWWVSRRSPMLGWSFVVEAIISDGYGK